MTEWAPSAVFLRNVATMSEYERRELARWLVSIATTVINEGDNFAKRVRFTYERGQDYDHGGADSVAA